MTNEVGIVTDYFNSAGLWTLDSIDHSVNRTKDDLTDSNYKFMKRCQDKQRQR